MQISFFDLVKEHENKYLFAANDYQNDNHQIAKSEFIDNRHKYVIEVLNMLNDINSSLEICISSIKQIEILPNKNWLNRVGLTPDRFVIYTYSCFTSLLYTTFDQLLLLVNNVNKSKLDNRCVNYKTIQKNICEDYSELKQGIKSIYIETNEIAKKRHSFIHHGQLRESPKMKEFRTVKVIFKMFKAPSNQISEYYQEATEELLHQMNKEYEMLKQKVVNIENMLIPLYEKKLQTIVGIDLSTEEYISLKNEALDFLDELHKID